MKTILPKLARWLGFHLLIALTPLFATLLALRASSRSAGLKDIAGHGELLLIAAALGAIGIGEMVPFKTRKWLVSKILLVALTLCSVLVSSMYFAFIMLGASNESTVSYDSLLIFIFTVLLSGTCVAVSEV